MPGFMDVKGKSIREGMATNTIVVAVEDIPHLQLFPAARIDSVSEVNFGPTM